MAQVVTLQGKILQVRSIDTPGTVGYGATYEVSRGMRIATVAIGYADGYFRALSNTATAYVGEYSAKVVGRVSMDLITLDVSEVPEDLCQPGLMAELLGTRYTVDDMARDAGTIGYEVLTSLGPRHTRVYVGATA